MSSPQKPRPNASVVEPLKRHACIVVIVRFIDDNKRTFYSRDIDHTNDPKKYRNVAYWLYQWKKRIEFEEPDGWKGRVKEAAIFHSFDGNRGDKIDQFIKNEGGWQSAIQ
jgi:hypothetical protein